MDNKRVFRQMPVRRTAVREITTGADAFATKVFKLHTSMVLEHECGLLSDGILKIAIAMGLVI